MLTGLGADDVFVRKSAPSILVVCGVDTPEVEFDGRISSSTPSMAFLDAHRRASGSTGSSCEEKYSLSAGARNLSRVSVELINRDTKDGKLRQELTDNIIPILILQVSQKSRVLWIGV
jgi:hypothetical protein